jgi:hypothetical protein
MDISQMDRKTQTESQMDRQRIRWTNRHIDELTDRQIYKADKQVSIEPKLGTSLSLSRIS